MGEQMKKKESKKHICLGILAHVDAGKTTLSEALLYLGGSIRKMGRVDHKDAFLDTFELERARGITIFSKQAQLTFGDMELTLLDTPGHVDFAAEMERTLQVLDYAVLVISGADGVQGHTETLWKLLAQYRVPVFLFVNKMDQPGTDRQARMEELVRRLDGNCIDFGADPDSEEFLENLAMCDEDVMECYLETGEVTAEDTARMIRERKVFPCFFGSALKLTGVEELIEGLAKYTLNPVYPEEFGARVYKISRDEQGKRLTHMKITGGGLKARMVLTNRLPEVSEREDEILNAAGRDGKIRKQGAERARIPTGKADEGAGRTVRDSMVKAGKAGKTENGGISENPAMKNSGPAAREIPEDQIWEEKVDQIRIYSGTKFEAVQEAAAGAVCAVTGLTKTWPGQGLGIERETVLPVLSPVLTYRIDLPEDCDVHVALQKLRQLEEEEPQLHIVWNEQLGEIHAQVMGEVQIEILQSLIRDRYGMEVTFGTGNIVYKETIREPVEGAGHFEPLRHYAEVHLLLEPGEPGSGIQVESACSVDELDLNWQRLVLTHLLEKEHVGVLIGAPLTDVRITLTAGRSHLKHTEGGDFRQATYRAVRQGLKKADSVLLEPFYAFRLEVPSETVGRALSDIQRMYGSFDSPEIEGDMTVLTGSVPVSEMRGYQMEVSAYTKGRGRLAFRLEGYRPCHNAEEIIEEVGYDSERDLENPTGSVFCAHGAGFVVSWDKADSYMHVESGVEWVAEEDGKEKAVLRGFYRNAGSGCDFSSDTSGTEMMSDTGESSGKIPGKETQTGRRELSGGARRDGAQSGGMPPPMGMPSGTAYEDRFHDEEELKAIFARTYGTSSGESRMAWKRSKGSIASSGKRSGASSEKNSGAAGNFPRMDSRSGQNSVGAPGRTAKKEEPVTEYLLVDGYNIIFAWDELKELAEADIGAARTKLMDVLCNYQGFAECRLILVFDAYKVEGFTGEVIKYHNIYVVYTREAETADQYIEKTVREIGKRYHVTVATSDRLEQVIILGDGARRLSASDLKEEILYMNEQIRQAYRSRRENSGRNYLFDSLDEDLAQYMEEVRLGRSKFK